MSILYYVLLVGLLQQLCVVNVCSASTFNVVFAEVDSNGKEGEVRRVTARLDGQTFGEVEIQVVGFRTPDFLDRNIISQGVEDIDTNIDTAELADFEITGSETHTFPANDDRSVNHEFTFRIVDDEINEMQEQFVLLVNVTGTADGRDVPGNEGRRHVTVRIDVDPLAPDTTQLSVMALGLSEGVIRVSEAIAGGSIDIMLTIVNHPPENALEISVNTQDSPATSPSDYNIQVTSVTLTANTATYTVTVMIVNDMTPEQMEESVVVSFQNPGDGRMINIEPPLITIIIQDDDRVTYGFRTMNLTIREGEMGSAEVAILDPEMVDALVEVNVNFEIEPGTSIEGDRPPTTHPITLTQANRQQPFTINTDSDNNDGQDIRSFNIKISDSSVEYHAVDPAHQSLTVYIKDNDTEINFGIESVGSERRVLEGASINITVELLADKPLDNDFILGFSVMITYKDVNGGNNATDDDFTTTNIAGGTLTDATRRRNITIETMSNNEVEENRGFTVVITHASVNSPLVKLLPENRAAYVIIMDNDVVPPKPDVSVDNVIDKDEFEVKWKFNDTTPVNPPVTGYRVLIRIPGDGSTSGANVTRKINDKNIQNTPFSYKFGDVDYSKHFIYVQVCAQSDAGETCSDEVRYKRPGQGQTSPQDESSGPSGGAIAAIIIVLLLVCCLCLPLFLLLGFLCRKYCWRTYYPIIRETKHREEFAQSRAQFTTDV